MAKEDDIQRFAKSIHKNSARLLNLINDIIHLSELDVMEEKPDMEEVDIFHIARTAGDMLQMSADKHGVLLGVTGIPAMVMANRGMWKKLYTISLIMQSVITELMVQCGYMCIQMAI